MCVRLCVCVCVKMHKRKPFSSVRVLGLTKKKIINGKRAVGIKITPTKAETHTHTHTLTDLRSICVCAKIYVSVRSLMETLSLPYALN